MTIDPKRDALIVVDVQNDFCPGGSLGVPDGDAVVPVLNACIERFRAAGAPVYLTRDWHPPVTRHFSTHGGIWPPHCVQGTRGAEFHPRLTVPEDAEIVSKGARPDEDAYSAFQAVDARGEPLPRLLAARGVRRLFLGGLTTDYCVRATTLDARAAGFEVIVLEDAVRAVDLEPGDGERALEAMRAAGASLVTSSEVCGDPAC